MAVAEDEPPFAIPPFPWRTKLRLAITYLLFLVGHIWAAFSIYVFAGIAETASYDWPLAIENGWFENLLFDFCIIALAGANAALVIWLLYRGWRAWRGGALTLGRAAWPLVTFAIALVLAALLGLTLLYNDWAWRRHGGTGTIILTCEEITADANLIPSSFRIRHVRPTDEKPDEWYVAMPDVPEKRAQPIELITGSYGGSMGLKWRDQIGQEKIAAMSFSDMIGEYGHDSSAQVTIGAAANAPLDWTTEEGGKLAQQWQEQRLECQGGAETWSPD